MLVCLQPRLPAAHLLSALLDAGRFADNTNRRSCAGLRLCSDPESGPPTLPRPCQLGVLTRLGTDSARPLGHTHTHAPKVLVSSSSPPSVGCNDIDLRFLEDSSSFLSTALVAYTAVCWMFERHTVVRGCWVALSYLMYLLQSFGGDLFASLVRCDIAERREDAKVGCGDSRRRHRHFGGRTPVADSRRHGV